MQSISVIIPAKNEALSIGQVIASCRQAGECEVIVVDGGSTDETREQATDADTRLTSAPGRAVQQNAGAAAAGGDVLLFLHADCLLPVDAFDIIRQSLQDERVVGGAFRQIIAAEGWRYRLIAWGNSLRVRLFGWAYGDQGIFVRRDTFMQIGGFPILPLMEDLYFMKQLKRRGCITLLPTCLTVSARRWEREGVFRRTWKNWSLLLRAHLGWSLDQLANEYRDIR